MNYIGIYLPAQIGKTQTKQDFVDILPTTINIAQSSKYLANTSWRFSVDSR